MKKYQIVTYSESSGFDDKLDYSNLKAAEKDVRTKYSDYDGCGIWDRTQKKYVRTWGFFPTEEEVERVKKIMTEKGRVLHYLRNLSSGTIAGIIGSNKYQLIDRAASKAILHAASLTESECASVRTMEDYTNLVLAAQDRTDI